MMASPDNQPAPRKKRHGCLLGMAGAVALVILVSVIAAVAGGGGSGGSGGSGGTSAGGTGTGSGTGSGPAGVGDPVRDGKFQFVITSVGRRHSVGPAAFGGVAQGEFTILHVTVSNIGSESQSLSDSAQFVYDSSGRKFDADTEADIQANPAGGGAFLTDVNPGNSVRALILFDLPRGDRAVKAELHDSMFSGGVTVRLR